jgi:DNA sulfur modification protein DndD
MEVHHNGAFDPALTDTWAQRIETLLPLGLSNLFFFDGEQVRALAGDDEPTPEVKQAIRTLLGLELPAQLVKDLQLISRRSRKEISNQVTVEKINALEKELEALKSERGAINISIGHETVEAARAQKALDEAKSLFESQGGTLYQKRDELERERALVTQELDTARDQLRTLAEGVLPLMQVAGLLQSTLARAEKELSFQSNAIIVELLQERDQLLLEYLRDSGSPASLLATTQSFPISDLEDRQKDIQGEPYLGVSEEDVSLLRDVSNHRLPSEVKSSKQLVEVIEKAKARLQYIDQLLVSAPAPTDAMRLLAGVETATEKRSNALAQMEILQYELDGFEQQIAVKQHELKIALNQVFSTQQVQTEEARLITASERAIAVMNKYKERLKANKLTELERLVTDRFRHLARKDDLIHLVEIDSDNFSLMLYDNQGKRIPRNRLSAGEQQLLAVSFLWGLAEASGRSLPVVIDTPLARMDSTHRTNLVTRYVPHVSHQVIVLSTDVEVDRNYYKVLQDMGAIDRSYHIQYNAEERRSKVMDGYFWKEGTA